MTTRREFMKISAAAAAVPVFVSSSAFGANDRIIMGSIGTGGRGTGDMRSFTGFKEVQMVAVCDVVEAHRTRAKQYVDKAYGEFMKVKQCKSAKDCLKVAKKIYDLLKEANDEMKEQQEQKQEQQKQQGQQKQKSDQGEQDESGDGGSSDEKSDEGEKGDEEQDGQGGGSGAADDFEDEDEEGQEKGGSGGGSGDEDDEESEEDGSGSGGSDEESEDRFHQNKHPKE